MMDQIVAQRRELHVSRVVAAGAGIVGVPADLRAGRGFRFVVDEIVAERGNLASLEDVTAGADALFFSGLGAGRRRRLRPVTEVVAQSRDLCVGRIIASRAGVVSIPADVGAGRGLRLVVDEIVAECGNLARLEGVAAGTDPLFFSGFSAGRRRRLRPVPEVVAQCRELHIGRVVASRTGVIGIPADFSAGRSLCLMVDQIMTQRINLSGLCRIASGTDPVLYALFRTGRLCGHRPVAPGMAEFRKLDIGCIFASRTGVVGLPADVGAGRSFCLMVDQVMAGHRNHFGVCEAADTAKRLFAVGCTAGRGRDFLRKAVFHQSK